MVGWTALHCAAIDAHLDVLRLLLTHGADPELLDAEHLTSLQSVVVDTRPRLCRRDDQGRAARVFLAHGAVFGQEECC